jgi:hypothetical protein
MGEKIRCVMASLRAWTAAMLMPKGAAMQLIAMPRHPRCRLQPSSAKSTLAKTGRAGQLAVPTA